MIRYVGSTRSLPQRYATQATSSQVLRAECRLLVAARQPPPHAEPREGVLDLVERAYLREDALALAPLAADAHGWPAATLTDDGSR